MAEVFILLHAFIHHCSWSLLVACGHLLSQECIHLVACGIQKEGWVCGASGREITSRITIVFKAQVIQSPTFLLPLGGGHLHTDPNVRSDPVNLAV